jgi:hypothetical protein
MPKPESFYAVVKVEDISKGISGIIGCFETEAMALLVREIAMRQPGASSLYTIPGSQMCKMLGVEESTTQPGWFDFTLDLSAEKLVALVGKRVKEPLSPDVAFKAESGRQPTASKP